jgi:hypothetical protein
MVELSIPRPIGCGLLLAQGPNALVSEAKFTVDHCPRQFHGSGIMHHAFLRWRKRRPLRTIALSRQRNQDLGERLANISGASLLICQGVLGATNGASRSSGSDFQTGTDRVAEAGIRRLLFGFRFALPSGMGKISARFAGPFPPSPTRRKLATLSNVVRHSKAMRGYMCVYLRLKGIVLASTAPW